jgi:hypothetical protein
MLTVSGAENESIFAKNFIEIMRLGLLMQRAIPSRRSADARYFFDGFWWPDAMYC